MSQTASSSPDTAQSAPERFAVSLSLDNLSLARGGARLFSHLNLTAGPGEALMLLGRNGSGKTSLLRALAGLLTPEGGRIRWLDGDDEIDPSRAIAWLGHADGIKPAETPRQALDFWADQHGRPREETHRALKALGVHRLADRPAARLSRGQQRRTAIARLLLSHRPVWLLDEPAGPLDAPGRGLLARAVASHRARGGLVVAATHQALNWPRAQSVDMGDYK